MSASPWRRRIHRAQELVRQHSFAAEILEFYINLTEFQERLHGGLSAVMQVHAGPVSGELSQAELAELTSHFASFLAMVEAQGPERSAELSRELMDRGPNFWRDLLRGAWTVSSPSDTPGFLAWAFLQPYAELRRSRTSAGPVESSRAVCPFCNRRPSVGALRQRGEGAARSMICAFCLGEWDFRRILCPGCGEENHQKLPVFHAEDFNYVRIECCDTCKTYIKTVDFTKNGHAETLVDDLVSSPLDLWTRDRGYARLQPNFLGF